MLQFDLFQPAEPVHKHGTRVHGLKFNRICGIFERNPNGWNLLALSCSRAIKKKLTTTAAVLSTTAASSYVYLDELKIKGDAPQQYLAKRSSDVVQFRASNSPGYLRPGRCVRHPPGLLNPY